jgi:carboxyl-terminal processing protease
MVGVLAMNAVGLRFLMLLRAAALAAPLFLAGCRHPGAESAESTTSVPAAPPGAEEYRELALFTEALLLVSRYHVAESDFRELVYSAIEGMVGGLDEHSEFLAPESLKLLDESTEGRFVGIGVNVEPGRDGVKVVAPLEGSPALNAGIRAGDTITAVNGDSLQGVTLQDAVEKIRGDSGSRVQVTVEQADGATREVELVRGDIKLSSVQSCRMADEATGFLRVRQFTHSTASEVAEALDALLKKGMRRLVFDLRDNPGGVLNAAVEVAGLFLEKGDLIVSLKSRGGQEQEREYRAAGGRKPPRFPVAVLVNRGSASAAEVVAGALRDNRRAVLIGERTYGKASVQSVIKMSLRPECAVRLTTGHYFTPAGELIDGEGIRPDEELRLAHGDEQGIKRHYMQNSFRNSSADGAEIFADDRQLARALEVLGEEGDFGGNL